MNTPTTRCTTAPISVAQHLAVRLPPARENLDRIAVHPDIPFTLRLTDRPASADDAAAQFVADEDGPLRISDLQRT